MITTRFALFGDDFGLPLALKHIPREAVCALIGAGIRPHQHEKISALAISCDAPFIIQPPAESADYNGFIRDFRSCYPDLIMVVSYSMLLRPEILAVPKEASVNVHGGLLPQYRGCNPVQWAIINNETEAGVTMHLMTSDFDSGDIIAQRTVPILFDDTWVDVQRRISDATDRLLGEQIPRILAGEIVVTPQDGNRANYYRRRRPEDGLIDWDKSALEIYNLIRALVAPHPGAFFIDNSGRVTIDRYWSIPEVVEKKFELRKHLFDISGITLCPITGAENVSESIRLLRCSSRAPDKDRVASACSPIPSIANRSNHALSFTYERSDGKRDSVMCLHNIDYRMHEAGLTIYQTGPTGRYEDLGAAIIALCVLSTREFRLRRFKLGLPRGQKLALPELSMISAKAGYRCVADPGDERGISIEALE